MNEIDRTVSPNRPYGSPTGGGGERRFLTILFVDLVGYTPLSEKLDAEDLGVLQQRYQQLVLATMESFGGFVARFDGDGALVYFGYPRAHERDAERALRAALELQRRIGEIDTEVQGVRLPPLTCRIGVHSGHVLMAPETLSYGAGIPGAVGDVANLAARLQSEAPPGAVLISQETFELVEGAFDCESLGTRPIKGLSREVAVFRVDGVIRDAGSSLLRLQRGATQMVGREDAIERLLQRWRTAAYEGRRQCVAVVGEAGIGKTRLLLEFGQLGEVAEARSLQATCREMLARTPLHPVASFLWAQAGLTNESDDIECTRKIGEFLEGLGLQSSEHMELVASLLGLASPGSLEAIAPTPQVLKRRQYEFVVSIVVQIASSRPTILWIEDAHWLDASSAELLGEIHQATKALPLLIVITTRTTRQGPALPEFDETIELQQLATGDCLELARSVPGVESLGSDIVTQAIKASDGVPLFLEQLVISLLDERIELPGRNRRIAGMPLVLAQLMSERLDRIPGGRRIVLAAACIGRPFTTDMLNAILEEDAPQVEEPLAALVEGEILLSKRYGSEVRYEFRHALLQRMAYESMVQSERRAMHQRIATVLRGSSLGRPEIPEIIAHHLTEAGSYKDGIEAWLRAGVTAGRMSAHAEAVGHLRNGLSLLDRVSDEAQRRALELDLQVALMSSIMATKSATSLELSACCDRGLALCEQAEPTPLVFPFLFGQFTHVNCRGRLEEAEGLARRFLELASRFGNESARVIGHRMLGMVLLGADQAKAARKELETSLELYDKERDEPTTHMFGQNTEVHTKSLLSLTLLCLGEVDAALEIGASALKTADALRHPHSTGIPLVYVGGWVYGLCGAVDDLMREAHRLLSLAEVHRLAGFRAHGVSFLGWAMCQRGALAQGIAAIEQGIVAFDSVEFHLALAGHLANLADAQCRAGRLMDADRASLRALELLPEGSLWLGPEVARVRAVVLRQVAPDRANAARDMLVSAVGQARTSGFSVAEYRCLTSLKPMLEPAEFAREFEPRLEQLASLRSLGQRVAAKAK